MRGYKAMNEDMTCRGFQYEVGKTYEIDGDIQICEKGFHFCQDITSVFHYYKRFKCRVFEVEADGDIQKFYYNDKFCCQKITILREVKGIELNRVIYGNGYGDGDSYYGNNGDGSGNGVFYFGDSYGSGFGYGHNTYGYGNGFGNGYDDGYGCGYGYGYGDGYGEDIQKILKFMEE